MFGPGRTQEHNAILQVVNDTVIEGQETLTISLTNPQPPDAVALLGSTTIIITNDDFRELQVMKKDHYWRVKRAYLVV